MKHNLILFGASLFVAVAQAYDWTGKTGVVTLTESATVEEADAAAVAALTGIVLDGADVQLIFRNTGALTMSGYICGEGKIVKNGSGDVTLATVASSGIAQIDKKCADNYTAGGIAVNAGNLYLPQAGKKTCIYGPIAIASGATLYVQPDSTTCCDALNGAGTVTTATAVTTANDKKDFQVGRYGTKLVSAFTGLVGGNLTIIAAGNMTLTNPDSSFGGQVYVQHAAYSTGSGESGCLYVPSFGMRDANSPVGVGNKYKKSYSAAIDIQLDYGGKMHYTGTADETTDKCFRFGSTYNYGVGPDVFDAGAHGGVTFTGKWDNYTQAKMGGVVLAGSNTADMVLANAIDCVRNAQAHFQFKKTGPGCWRLNDHADRSGYIGGWFVEEGTLKYESIADIGVNCSLGLSTACVPFAYGADWSASYVADNRLPYEIQLGSESAVPTLAFVGTGANASNRRIGLVGLGGRLAADGGTGTLALTGGVAVASGETAANNLTLCGAGCARAEISGIAPEINVAKEGAGTWCVAGPYAPEGKIAVKAGALKLEPKGHTPYTWYRFTITQCAKKNDSGASQYLWLRQLAFFDADGNRLATGLTYVGPTSGGPHGNTEFDWTDLNPGEVTFGAFNSGCNGVSINGESNTPAELFVDSDSYFRGHMPAAVTEANGVQAVPIVLRLPAGSATPKYYDIEQRIDHTADNHVQLFKLEGSADGASWTELHHETQCRERSAGQWNSTGVTATYGGQNCRVSGSEFGYEIASGTENPDAWELAGASEIAVAGGATLECNPAGGLTLPKLSVDCAGEGDATVKGFAIAATGVLNLANEPKAVKYDLPVAFTNCTNLSNFTNWSVTVNGKKRGRKITVSDGKVSVARKGLLMLVR